MGCLGPQGSFSRGVWYIWSYVCLVPFPCLWAAALLPRLSQMRVWTWPWGSACVVWLRQGRLAGRGAWVFRD